MIQYICAHLISMRLERVFIILLSVLFSVSLFGQQSYVTKRISEKIELDGLLNEDAWKSVEPATDFITSYPGFGLETKYKSEVYMVYDDDAIYIAGRFVDPQPDSVNYSLSQRDDVGNADWFKVLIDPYSKGVSGFSFSVTAAGVEVDALEFTEGSDGTWNAVWKSKTVKTTHGWNVEIRIPFSAIRFPNKAVQDWNINFYRQVRRDRELSTWAPVDPEVYGELAQCVPLVGLTDITSPIRLSFTPYATGYIENSYDSELGKQTWKQRATGGMDLKYGINDAFTLDVSLIPDFGQTVSDQQVLNLGPFEVRYNENRPFFLEGTDLFSIGGVFYSRRIGGVPYYRYNIDVEDGEEVVNNPSISPIVNASKVSGRTKKGLGIGVFNAIEGRATATIMDSMGNNRFVETNPLTNYNVVSFSQNLNNNSSVSFLNTNVFRSGSARDANVSVASAQIFSKDRKYSVNTTTKVSMISEDGTEYGHSQYMRVAKVAGIWKYGLSYGEESDTYDPNDLGFLYANNSRWYQVDMNWNRFVPGKYFLRRWANANIYYEELYSPRRFSYFQLNWGYVGTLKNFLTVGLNGNFNPVGEVNHFESRQFGKEVVFAPSAQIGGFYSSDYSKTFALDVRFWYKKFMNPGQQGGSITVSPRIRFSDRLFIVWRSTYDRYLGDYGYVYPLESAYEDKILLGTRNRDLVVNSLSGEFIFTNRMGLDIQLRHYWQQVAYKEFNQLLDEGETIPTNYYPLNEDGESQHNTSYNAFTLDVNYRWVFWPGSELRIVYKNNIFKSQNRLDGTYFNTFEDLFLQPQINSISLRLLVYVDVLYFKRKNRK